MNPLPLPCDSLRLSLSTSPGRRSKKGWRRDSGINRLNLLHDSELVRAGRQGPRRLSPSQEHRAVRTRSPRACSAERCLRRSQNDRKHLHGTARIELARDCHPVDVIEQVAHNNDWSFERTGDDEIAITVAGSLDRLPRLLLLDGGFRGAASCLRLRHQGARKPSARGDAAALADQRADAVRPFRPLGAGGRDHVPPVAAACRRRRADQPAGRGAAVERARSLRMLFPGVPVRRLVGHLGQGRAGRRAVRNHGNA